MSAEFIHTPSIGGSLDKKTTDALLKLAREASPASNQGEIYQSRFESVLSRLADEAIINGWRSTVQNSQDDARGIDYWLEYQGSEIPVQITALHRTGNSSRHKKTKALREQGVIVLYLRYRESGRLKEPYSVRRQLLKALQAHTPNLA